MNILLIIIIAGLALLTLGSPDTVKQAGTDIANLVQQIPKQINQEKNKMIEESKQVENVNFSNVGYQKDIPASAVLGGNIISPDTVLEGDLFYSKGSANPVSYEHQDTHTMQEIHSANAAALKILDRISSNY